MLMQVTFNPKDTNTFASASLDRSVKVWSIGQPTPNFTLEGHEKGVNAVDYFTGGKPLLCGTLSDVAPRGMTCAWHWAQARSLLSVLVQETGHTELLCSRQSAL